MESCLFWYPGHELSLQNIIRAENCHLFDNAGNRFLDLESGVWCTCLGHGHPEVLKTMTRQAAELPHTGFGFTSPIVEDTAQRVLDLHGLHRGRAVFLCSGSEAIEFGIRVTQDALGEAFFLTMAESYFGAYGAAHEKVEDQWTLFDWTPCKDCAGESCDQDCRHWAAMPFDKINAFIFEPGSAAGLVGFPPTKLVRAITSEIQEKKGIVLVNEVTTGMGRTGKWFGYEHYGIVPDIVAMGKGLGNGYPVSAAVVSERVSLMLKGDTIAYAQSHQNDPLGAAVAGTVIEEIRSKGLIEHAVRLSDCLMTGLNGIRESSGLIREIRGRGLMVALELEGDENMARQVRQELLARGYILGQRPGLNVLRIDPALTMDIDDLEGFLQTFGHILNHR